MNNSNIKVACFGAADRTVELPDGRIFHALWLDDFNEEDFERWKREESAATTLGEATQVQRNHIKEFVPTITDDDLRGLKYRWLSGLCETLMVWERAASVPEGTTASPLASPSAPD